MGLKLGNLQLPTLGCSHTLHFKHYRHPDTDLGFPPFDYFLFNKDVHQKKLMEISLLYVSGRAGTPVHWAANRGMTAAGKFYSDVV